jgi:16S rRNA (guanine527-N7)-methyltransferase
VKQGDISEFAQALDLRLDPGQIQRLIDFESLLVERAVPTGMVSSSDVPRLRERHILDSLRAAVPEVVGDAVTAGEAQPLIDLGSGAGLPGVVLAVALPQSSMMLVEKRPKRAAFLELVVRELPLPNASVFAGSVEALTSGTEAGRPAAVCFARAFKPMDQSWEIASRLLRPGGRLVYFAGAGNGAEVGAGAAQAQALRADGAKGHGDFEEKNVKVRVEPCPLLESAGPLVIMARK